MTEKLIIDEERREELIGGHLVAMAPASVSHSLIKLNIAAIFRAHLRGHACMALPDGVAVYLTETDYYMPDAMIVCDPDKIKPDGVHGAPDLVVEVLSPSTARYDRGRKMDVYEVAGVREYWIVSPGEKSIDQYILMDGSFVLAEHYAIYPDWMLARMSDAERGEIKNEIRVSLYDDLAIPLKDIFERIL